MAKNLLCKARRRLCFCAPCFFPVTVSHKNFFIQLHFSARCVHLFNFPSGQKLLSFEIFKTDIETKVISSQLAKTKQNFKILQLLPVKAASCPNLTQISTNLHLLNRNAWTYGNYLAFGPNSRIYLQISAFLQMGIIGHQFIQNKATVPVIKNGPFCRKELSFVFFISQRFLFFFHSLGFLTAFQLRTQHKLIQFGSFFARKSWHFTRDSVLGAL